jgi:hypothetical protein
LQFRDLPPHPGPAGLGSETFYGRLEWKSSITGQGAGFLDVNFESSALRWRVIVRPPKGNHCIERILPAAGAPLFAVDASMVDEETLPPNPYRRVPIKRLSDLSGRSQERKRLQYYLNLTASGDSPHVALIGERGIGKTSLLNAAEEIANEAKLLTVRIDLNELKARSIGRFWHDLYQALALSAAKKGCWGGEHGAIYAELLRMMHARRPRDLDKAVLQIPYVFSCHQGSIDDFECPDALVISDIGACISELRANGLTTKLHRRKGHLVRQTFRSPHAQFVQVAACIFRFLR